jgi:hypothetical protein
LVAAAAPIRATLWREEASPLAGPDRIRDLTDAPFASSLTREFGSTVARLLSAKTITAAALDVAISSPTTTGRDATAVAGTGLPFTVTAPELVILPTGPAAASSAAITAKSTNIRFMTDSCEAAQFQYTRAQTALQDITRNSELIVV